MEAGAGRAVAADDAGQVRAARAGDRAAFGELYQRYARMVHGILLARVPPADADDLTQEVFLQAWREVRKLREDAAFGGWLAQIARNRARGIPVMVTFAGGYARQVEGTVTIHCNTVLAAQEVFASGGKCE